MPRRLFCRIDSSQDSEPRPDDEDATRPLSPSSNL
ncbi:hypothetical protein AVEN_204254-1, partial [Araneus ventricosus]